MAPTQLPPTGSGDRVAEMSRLQSQAWAALAQARDPKTALALYRQVYELGEDPPGVDVFLYRRLAELACAEGDLDYAVEVASRGLSELEAPGQGESRVIERVHLRRLERLLRLNRDRETDPTLIAYCALRQRFLWMRGVPASVDAQTVETEIGTQLANHPRTRIRGELLYLLGISSRDASADAALRRVVDEAPRSAAAPEAISLLILHAGEDSAESAVWGQRLCSDYPESEPCLAAAARLLGTSRDGKYRLPYSEARAAAARVITLYRGHFADAAEFFAHYPYEALLQFAERQRALGHLVDAIESLRQATELVPGGFEAWAQIGEIAERRGDLPRAADAYERASHCDVPQVAGGYRRTREWGARVQRLRKAIGEAPPEG